jgi:hypothetical protein
MPKLALGTYETFAYLISGIAVLLASEQAFGFPQILGASLQITDVAALVLFMSAYIIGHLNAMVSRAILEDLLVHRVLRPPSVNLVQPNRTSLLRFVFPSYYRPLAPATRERLLKKAEEHGVGTTGEPLFELVRFSPEIRTDQQVIERITAFLNHYGFSRNMSSAALMSVLIFLLGLWLHEIEGSTRYYIYIAASAIIGVGMFYRYLKFFRQYSYEIFNCYAAGEVPKAKSSRPHRA